MKPCLREKLTKMKSWQGEEENLMEVSRKKRGRTSPCLSKDENAAHWMMIVGVHCLPIISLPTFSLLPFSLGSLIPPCSNFGFNPPPCPTLARTQFPRPAHLGQIWTRALEAIRHFACAKELKCQRGNLFSLSYFKVLNQDVWPKALYDCKDLSDRVSAYPA